MSGFLHFHFPPLTASVDIEEDRYLFGFDALTNICPPKNRHKKGNFK